MGPYLSIYTLLLCMEANIGSLSKSSKLGQRCCSIYVGHFKWVTYHGLRIRTVVSVERFWLSDLNLKDILCSNAFVS